MASPSSGGAAELNKVIRTSTFDEEVKISNYFEDVRNPMLAVLII